VRIANVEIGRGHPCRFIAELSNNHNGRFETALKLINAAKAAGADFVKFQAYTPSELVDLRGDGKAPEPWGSQGWTMRALYEKAQTPPEWFADLFAYAIGQGLTPFASVFGAESLELMESLGAPAYKLASLDVKKKQLVKMVSETGKPVIRSAPGDRPPSGDALFLYCPAGYPQPAIDWTPMHRGFDGFSYHGTDPSIPGLAIAQGAKLIEAHLQLDDEPSELEANVSLTGEAFARLVSGAKRVEMFS
jgi:sialic acid synthase SpsE